MSRKRKVLTTAALTAIATPAAVSVSSGWVGLGSTAGFGPVDMLPGIGNGFVINTAITLPISVEAYSATALGSGSATSATSRRSGSRASRPSPRC